MIAGPRTAARTIALWTAVAVLAWANCGALSAKTPATQAAPAEAPALSARVKSGSLPPLAERLPVRPLVVPMNGNGLSPGRHGGVLNFLMAKPKDVRMMTVYGYARLAVYNADLEIYPDILFHAVHVQWRYISGELVETRTSPPWFTAEEILQAVEGVKE